MASNLLSHIAHRHLTPSIGTLFPSSFQLSSLLPSSPSSTPSSTSKSTLTALSHLTSTRGVVFFRSQDITPPQLTSFASLLGTHSTPLRPSTSTLHRHPISEDTPEITVISSADSGVSRAGLDLRNRASTGWHSDISFEHVPADYSILKMHTLPVGSGGDTLFASGYEAYERLSPTYRRFLEGLKAVHAAPFFVQIAKEKGIKIQDGRGSPSNTGDDLIAIQYVLSLSLPLLFIRSYLHAYSPVIRTHPITKRKALYVNKSFTRSIVGLHPEESEMILDNLFRHVAENHDFQVSPSLLPSLLFPSPSSHPFFFSALSFSHSLTLTHNTHTGPLPMAHQRHRHLGQPMHLSHWHQRLRSFAITVWRSRGEYW